MMVVQNFQLTVRAVSRRPDEVGWNLAYITEP